MFRQLSLWSGFKAGLLNISIYSVNNTLVFHTRDMDLTIKYYLKGRSGVAPNVAIFTIIIIARKSANMIIRIKRIWGV